MKFEFVDAQKACFPVDFMCQQLGVSRSGYYAWRQRPNSTWATDMTYVWTRQGWLYLAVILDLFSRGVALGPGSAHLRLVYEGVLSEREVSGAFRAREAGDWYAFTQFEPLGARRVFPCFDEPGFKVPWQLTFHVPAGPTVLTNTPVVSQEPGGAGGSTWRFARTQPLPSYLVAFAVGPFDFLDAEASGEKAVRTRIVTTRGRAYRRDRGHVKGEGWSAGAEEDR